MTPFDLTDLRAADTDTPLRRLLNRCVVTPSGCWVWLGATDRRGYGRHRPTVVGQSTLVHRAVFTLTHGPLSPTTVLDHLCRNPGCCNPFHLDPVTQRTNTLRGLGPAAQAAVQTSCIHGHPFDVANTLIRRNGTRMCRTCNARRQRETQARKSA